MSVGSALARGCFRLRRLMVERIGLLAAAAAGVALGLGFFERLGLDLHHPWELLAFGCLAVLLLVRLAVGRPAPRARFAAQVDRMEAGLLLLATIYAVIQAAGGPESRSQTLVYLAVAYLVGFNARPVGALLTVGAVAFQALLHHAAGELPHTPGPLLLQAGFILVFALANAFLLQTEVLRRRQEHRSRLRAEIQAMRDEARDFRLVSPVLAADGAGANRAEMESKLARGAVEAIHQSMFFMLELLKKSLDLQTCVVLWLDASGQRLKIKELVTDSNMVHEVPLPARAGALGGVVSSRLLLNLTGIRRVGGKVPYYSGPEQVGAFLGVPVLEGAHLRGVLCADRRDDRAFTEAEEQLMLQASRQVLRAIQSERVFAAVERSKYEHERFHNASSMLNNALTLGQVYDTAFAAARQIAAFDFGAITLHDPKRSRHIICRVEGEDRDRFEGKDFKSNAGLVSMVVKNRHYLPAGTQARERDAMVFTRRMRVRGMESLLVLPLIVQEAAVGTIVLAGRRRGLFSKNVREMLGVITNQVAVSIQNAKMYKQMEEMATTDGLTGLPNHRTFQSRFSEMLHRAERTDKPVSLVLTDIDKFKNVNDTYGHPVGDMVLRRMAGVLAAEIRKVDLAARYGGEEFALVLEETDEEGARLFCERVRQEVAAQVMSSEKGPFRVTLSLGVATWPENGTEKQQLIERADQALYAAKEEGRNRTVMYSDLKKVRNDKTVCSRHQCASS